jgi:vacuolar-type H+-ATPase subunit B/Vma2
MQVTYSGNIFGRVFRGTGEPIDGGPDLSNDPKVTIGGPSVNPSATSAGLQDDPYQRADDRRL